MKKSKKGNSRKFNSTFLLAGIVIILIAILAILLGFNYLNKAPLLQMGGNHSLIYYV